MIIIPRAMAFSTNMEKLPHSPLPILKYVQLYIKLSPLNIQNHFLKSLRYNFTLMILKKENQIYKRHLNQKKVHNSLKQSDRVFLSLIS